MQLHGYLRQRLVSMRSHCYDRVVPRHADPEQQRAAIAEAVGDLLAGGGVEAVSLRSVAAAAGVSMGRVQHYYRTKDDLLLDTLRRSHLEMEHHIEGRVSAPGAPIDILTTILEELLGEHPATQRAIRVSAAFAVRASKSPKVMAILTDGDEEILALAVEVVRQAQFAGAAPSELDPLLEAKALVALASGLGTSVALYGTSSDEARATLHHQLRKYAH